MRLLLFIVLLTSNVYAAEYTGLVVVISDGDTIKVLDDHKTQHTVRLAGIDAPEKDQGFGQRSKQSLSDLIYKKQVTISNQGSQ